MSVEHQNILKFESSSSDDDIDIKVSSDSSNEMSDEQDVGDITQYDLALRWISNETQTTETLENLQNTLCDGLQNRISTLNIITDLSIFSSIKCDSNDVILLFKYNEPDCYKQLILGPPPNDSTETEKFQFIWGEKIDGRILHVVGCKYNWNETWKTNEYFIRVLMQRHFNATNDQLVFSHSSLVNHLPHLSSQQLIIEAFGELREHFIGMYLPLSIHEVRCSSPAYRYTSFALPQQIKNEERKYQQLFIESIPIIINFETSNKWPDELHGIKLMKTAFSIKMRELLFDKGIKSRVFRDRFEVYHHGFVFNVIFDVPQELALYRLNAPESVSNYQIIHNHIPQTNNWLRQFPGKYSSMSTSCRLLKHWDFISIIITLLS
ncbi:Nucleolar RNA-associated protein [Entamoeba marina]